MSYSILNCKTDLAASLHGTNLNKVTSINSLFNRAASQLLMDLDPQETKRIVQMTNPIFAEVYDYVLPSDLKGNRIIDIRPQTNRKPMDVMTQTFNQDFDLYKEFSKNPFFSIQFNNGIKTIRIQNNSLSSGVCLNNADSVSGNGTWTVGGSASDLRENNVDFVSGTSSSIEFDLAVSGSSGYVTNSTMDAQDLSEQLNQGTYFYWVFLPTGSSFTNVQLQWGSDGSNFWYANSTSCFDGTAFQNGWNLLKADWKTATKVSNPNASAIDTLTVLFTYDGTAQTGVKVNSIWCKMGTIMEIEYYSKYLFRDNSSGAFQENVTNDSNLINLDTETRNLFFYLVGSFAVQQIQGLDAQFYDDNFFGQRYENGLLKYKQMYKSEIQKPQTSYYDMPNTSYRKFFGNRFNY